VDDICPPQFVACYTPEEWEDMILLYGEEDVFIPEHPIGDAEAVANFTWEILFLSPWELIYIALPMSVLATYGLTIYFAYKWIQKKFS